MKLNSLLINNGKRNAIFAILSVLNILAPSSAFALFCPNNFNQIYIGDSIEQVTERCGKPAIQETKDRPKEGPQEWSYFIPQTVSSNTLQQEQGTLKTSVTFNADNQAINISVNGIGVGSSTICGNPIQLGATREQIKAACGAPSFINKQNGSSEALGEQPPPDKVTTFVYGGGGSASSTLMFENGRLVEKK